ncbi:hypothetical protein D6764_04570 [Candidatus Woesearchaeota archaeon]|nr:MAG: hypothetical protein D6764_04570 [Candidatus Woesearchaeota archaeon]
MAESDREIHITYDTLVDISRRERNKPELQKLDNTFYSDVLKYLAEKKKILDEIKAKSGAFDSQEQKALFQINNAKKLVRDIYERRERKIIAMALNRSRTGSDIIDTSTLLDDEKKLYEELVSVLDRFRKGVLNNVLSMKKPVLREEKPSKPAQEEETKSQKEEQDSREEPSEDYVLVRFLHAVPRFVGTDLSAYGPFEEEDIAKLPKDVARVLISKGRAEEIKQGQ